MVKSYIEHIDNYEKTFQSNFDYLKTIVFAQEKNARIAIREDYEYLMKRNYEVMKNNEESLKELLTNKEAVCATLWRRIAISVKKYVRRTDTRRHHMAELRKLDAESAIEIFENQERIKKLEETISILNKEYKTIVQENKEYQKNLENDEKLKTHEVIKSRKILMKNNKDDGRKIKLLTISSNDSLEHLKKLLRIIEHCNFLYNSCQKYETINECLNKWLSKEIGLKYPYIPIDQQLIESSAQIQKHEEIFDDFIVKGSRYQIDTKEIIRKAFGLKKSTSKRSSAPSKLLYRSAKVRPETAVTRKSSAGLSTPDRPIINTMCNVIIQSKTEDINSSCDISPVSEESQENPVDNLMFIPELEANVGCFSKLNNFWNLQSKVIIDIKELKEEKADLIQDNERMRIVLRKILEIAALHGSYIKFEEVEYVSSSLRSSSSTSLFT